jgi:hypothetical protein
VTECAPLIVHKISFLTPLHRSSPSPSICLQCMSFARLHTLFDRPLLSHPTPKRQRPQSQICLRCVTNSSLLFLCPTTQIYNLGPAKDKEARNSQSPPCFTLHFRLHAINLMFSPQRITSIFTPKMLMTSWHSAPACETQDCELSLFPFMRFQDAASSQRMIPTLFGRQAETRPLRGHTPSA